MLNKLKLNLYSNKYKVINNFFNKKEVNYFYESINKEIKSLQKDYFSHMDFKKYFNTMYQFENRLSRILSYRVLDSKKFEKIRKKIDNNSLINPLFYIHVFKKKNTKSKKSHPLLDTLLHYDFPYKLYANTYWVGLLPANEKTGTICFPKTKRLISKFLPNKNFINKYNAEKYIKNHKKLDPFIKKDIQKIRLEPGSAVKWSSEVCHGATRAEESGTLRITFNFRTILKKHLYMSQPNIIKFVEDFNNDVDIYNFLNLMNLGDYKHCARLVKKNKRLSKFKNYLNSLNKKKCNNLIRSKPLETPNWREEYSFTKNNFF